MNGITEEDKDMLRDRPVIASLSGGKDSTALALWLREQGIQFRAVFMDTGWEHPDTYEYLRSLPQHIGVEIEWIDPPLFMPALILHEGCFPTLHRRFCTRQLKIKPVSRWLRCEYPTGLPILANGIRYSESKSRARMNRWDEFPEHRQVWLWRPLLPLSEQDVIDLHSRHGVPPNPLYLRQSTRVGCWPCIFASKSDIRSVAEETPWRIDEIRTLEKSIWQITKERLEKAGTSFNPGTVGMFFQASWQGVGKPCLGVDEMVSWSKTKRGGKQFALFGREEGCVRWGLCEA